MTGDISVFRSVFKQSPTELHVLTILTASRTSMMQRCEGAGVETPFDIMGLEDEERDKLLDMPQSQASDMPPSRVS